jgi:dienelactone hydrolase
MILIAALLLASGEAVLDGLEERARQALDALQHARTLDEAARRRPMLRDRLRASLGLDLLPRAHPLKARIVGIISRPGYRIEKVTYEVLPDVLVPAHLYVPENINGRAPAILFYPGHWWADSKMRPDFQAFCITMARLGFMVLSWDPFGQGERGVSSRDHRRIETLLVGISQQGLAEYETQCAIRYLLSRREVDPKRLGITGASGGGYNTWITSALDDRIAVAVPVVGTSEFYEQIHVTRPLDWYRAAEHCHFVPGLIKYANNHELLAMAAPRPLMIIAASKDQSFPIAGVKQVYEYGRALYDSDRIGFYEDTVEGHGYQIRKREAAYGWFLRWLMQKGDGAAFNEPPVETAAVDDSEYRCFAEKQASGRGFVAYAAALAARRPKPRVDELSHVLGIPEPRPASRPVSPQPEHVVLTLSDSGALEVPGPWTTQPIDARGFGERSIAQKGWAAAVSLLLGENLVGQQALDLERAIHSVQSAGKRIAVYARGHNAALAATYAAARNPTVAAWILRDGFVTYHHFIERPAEQKKSFVLHAADRDRTTAFDREIPFMYVPFNALRHFDLPDLLSLANRVLVVNPIDGDWNRMAAYTAEKWLPRSVALVSGDDPTRAIADHLARAFKAMRRGRRQADSSP